MSKMIGGWTRVLADRHDQERFAADMTTLRVLGSAFTGRPAWQHDTIFTQLRNDMSPEARRAVFGGWPTTPAHFRVMWEAA